MQIRKTWTTELQKACQFCGQQWDRHHMQKWKV